MIVSKAYADIIQPGSIGVSVTDPNVLTTALVGGVISITALAFFIFLIIGAVKYVSSGGDKAAVQSAQKTLTNAAIGLVLTAAAFAIAILLQSILGINILSVSI